MPKTETLSPQRKFIQPLPGDDFAAIAARELPDLPKAEAVEKLEGWNMHISLMRQPAGLVTGSDIVFVEPPQGESVNMFLQSQDDAVNG